MVFAININDLVKKKDPHPHPLTNPHPHPSKNFFKNSYLNNQHQTDNDKRRKTKIVPLNQLNTEDNLSNIPYGNTVLFGEPSK